ncbi:hypothetical protein BK120_21170 [Paenibacillus sp. FSL A5-0031]|uniref:hypothetical protein n=1 Tax=Paenibacillus sp. FSL A5-0031 TaxID=1920420 RepID=UPI00096F844A|nr:hypothetical protein [Paenibacillus sp. FSL A5-0031]OME79502.1 hypothetical protein BK120_21170 [Paenibacillus sp. FSL A5-0031]
MKRFLAIFTLLFLTVSLLSGCLIQNKKDNDATNSTNKSEAITYTSEQKDLLNAISNNSFSKELPKEYTLSASIDLLKENDADRIQYEIFIEKTIIKMENLIMSFYLEPEMIDKLNTSSVYQSNTLNDMAIGIAPTGDALGATLGRAFILDKNKIDLETKDIYKTIYTKISYGDKDNRVENYIKLNATASVEIQNYLNKYLNK